MAVSVTVLTRLDAWRRKQPFGWDFHEYTTKNGGHVTQLAGMRCYSKRCACGALIVVRRDITKYKSPITRTGRWPESCDDCRRKKAEDHNRKATERMRRVRESRKEFRDEQFRRAGIPLPKLRGRHAVSV